jgi:hypothetical protein
MAGPASGNSEPIERDASSADRNCRPLFVICQPLASRSTNEFAKMSSLGAHAAKRFVRLVHGIATITARLIYDDRQAPMAAFARLPWN